MILCWLTLDFQFARWRLTRLSLAIDGALGAPCLSSCTLFILVDDGRGRGALALGEFFPDEVFVVAAVDHRIDFAAFVSAKDSAALGAGMKEEIGRFGLEENLRHFASFDVQLSAFAGDGEGFTRGDLIGSDEVVEVSGVDLSDGRIFVVAKELTGDDLPPAVAKEPGVGAVITGVEDLAVDDLGFVEVVAEDRGLFEYVA